MTTIIDDIRDQAEREYPCEDCGDTSSIEVNEIAYGWEVICTGCNEMLIEFDWPETPADHRGI